MLKRRKETSNDISRLKRALECKLQELITPNSQREALQTEFLADPLDQVRSNVNRDIVIQHFDMQTRCIHDIRSALDKIQHGEYGYCELCDEPISRRRLDAIPWARLCINCQSEVEDVAHGNEPTLDVAA